MDWSPCLGRLATLLRSGATETQKGDRIMKEPKLRNKIEGKINYDAENDYKKLFEQDMNDEGGLL